MSNFLNNVNLNLNQLQNAVLQVLATDPASPVNGQVWYNSATGVFKARLGGVTVQLGRLDQISAPTGPLGLNSQRITALADPTTATDAATKQYVDALIAGLKWKNEVRVASTANVSVTTGLVNGAVVDGITLATGDRVLLKNQTAAAENGIYVVVASGAASRSTDANTSTNILQAVMFVGQGTAFADTSWVLSTDPPITLGTTALTFVKFSGGATSTLNKFAVNIGDGAATSIAVAHALGTTDVEVNVYDTTASRNKVFPDIQVTDANTVTVIFSVAPAAGAYRVICIG